MRGHVPAHPGGRDDARRRLAHRRHGRRPGGDDRRIVGMVARSSCARRARGHAAGGGSASSPESATPAVPITAPTAPTITSIVGGDRKLTVNFSAPTSNGGAEITNYEHRFRGDALWTPRFPASTLGPIEITGLINGQSYEVEIRAAIGRHVLSINLLSNKKPHPKMWFIYFHNCMFILQSICGNTEWFQCL